jgi:hypothetical protein
VYVVARVQASTYVEPSDMLIQDPADRLPVSAIQSYYVRAGQQDGYLPVTYLLGIPAPLQSSQ